MFPSIPECLFKLACEASLRSFIEIWGLKIFGAWVSIWTCSIYVFAVSSRILSTFVRYELAWGLLIGSKPSFWYLFVTTATNCSGVSAIGSNFRILVIPSGKFDSLSPLFTCVIAFKDGLNPLKRPVLLSKWDAEFGPRVTFSRVVAYLSVLFFLVGESYENLLLRLTVKWHLSSCSCIYKSSFGSVTQL